MALDTQATKSMADTKKDSNPNELTMKKLKRILEVSSVICSTASVNMVIACLYGGVPDILGFKSQEVIFDMAFSLLVASVVLGTLAMATSRIQDKKLQIYFPALGISTLFSSLLSVILSFKNKDVAVCEKLSKPADTRTVLNDAECIKNLKEKGDNQENSISMDNFSIKNSEDGKYYLKNARKSAVFIPSSDKSWEIKCPPQLQKRHTPFLFGNCSVMQSPTHTKSLNFMQFDLGQMEKKSQLVPLLQQDFTTNGHFNEVNTGSIPDKRPKVGIVNPIKIKNSIDVEYSKYKNFSPSVECIHTCHKHLKKRFNPNSLVEQQNFYQNTGRMSNACFKVDNNILYESNVPIKTLNEFPSIQREVFNDGIFTTDLQNLHEGQNKFPKVRCHDTREIPYTELLQTVPQSSGEFSYKRSGIGKFNLHKMQEVDTGDHCYKLHRKVDQNFKNFQHPLRDFKEASHSQIGHNNNTHCGWNKSSTAWGEKFVERSDIPMEICDKAPNDQVLEVSLKLNDLNFTF